jgi:hypothetical protein
VKSVSLRVLARVLLDADALAVDSALDRATAAYRIVEHLAQGLNPLLFSLGRIFFCLVWWSLSTSRKV